MLGHDIIVLLLSLNRKDLIRYYWRDFFFYRKEAYTLSEIKKKCWEFLKPQINFEKYNIDPEQVKKDIKLMSLPVDFLLNADLK